AQPSERAASKNGDADRKQVSGDPGTTSAAADDQDRGNTRHGRHSRRYWRGNDDASAASLPRRQDARAYDRLYDSYGNRRDRSYGNTREHSYGDRRERSYSNTREQPYGDARDDQDNTGYRSDASRSDAGRYGRDARDRSRSRAITRDQPEETDRSIQARQPRSEPFWGGGSLRRGDRYQDDD